MSLLLKIKQLLLIPALLLSLSGAALADGGADASATTGTSKTCPDASLLSGKLITDICWSCIFPIRMMSVDMGGGDTPDRANNDYFCTCKDNNGVPEFGVGVGYWEPARIVELVREPGCAPSLGGVKLPGSKPTFWGTTGNGKRDSTDKSFYHYRYYAFPLLTMLDLMVTDGCASDGAIDFDLAYISELDPTWNDDQLAFFTNPEAATVANLPAMSACTLDAAKTAVGINDETFWWCMGAWGFTYPLSGHMGSHGFANDTSLAGSRAVAALHRRFLAKRTMGDDAMCKWQVDPMLPKSQYKISMFFPVPESGDTHIIGETVLTWGGGRMIPAYGEDAVYIYWRWNDCCLIY